jgi:hypothetical protein
MKTRDLFFRILTVVAGVGILVMVILGSTGMKEGMGENHVNAFLLSLLNVPLLSLFVVKSEPRPLSDLCKLASKVVGEHIEIRAFLAKGLPTIWADVGQIEQAQINLPDTWIQLLCY